VTVAPITHNHNAELQSLPVDYTAVLRHLGLNGADPKSQAVVLVCQRYDLDPILKHVVLVEGSVYITRDGLLHVAHDSGQFDGLEVEEAHLSEDGKEWRSRASVYRKDMSRPVVFSGRFPAGRKNSPEMAEKVAVARSLKHAFSVAIATEDERQAQDSTPTTPVPAPVTAAEIMGQPTAEPHVVESTVVPQAPTGGITRAQVAKIQAGCNDIGLTDRDLRLAWIAEQIGKPTVASTNDLTKAEASIVIDVLTAELAGLPDPTDQGDDGPADPTFPDPWDGE
jgi:hypothetical protein